MDDLGGKPSPYFWFNTHLVFVLCQVIQVVALEIPYLEVTNNLSKGHKKPFQKGHKEWPGDWFFHDEKDLISFIFQGEIVWNSGLLGGDFRIYGRTDALNLDPK